MTSIHWKDNFTAPKSKELQESLCSAYWYEDRYRVSVRNKKQVYYFELMLEENISETDLKQFVSDYMETHRDNTLVAKCIRCSQWKVDHDISSYLCPRCFAAQNSVGNTELDVVL